MKFSILSYFYDEETGLYYLNSRYYNPQWGRFISADNLLAVDNLLGNNLFAYCSNNPANCYDPTGQMSAAVPATAIVLSAFIGVLSYLYVNTGLGDIIAEGFSDAANAIGDVFDDVREKVEETLSKAKPYPIERTPELHHIVAQNAIGAAPARKILHDVGMNTSDVENLMLLKYSLHRRLHSQVYYNWVNNTLEAAYDPNLDDATNKAQVVAALNSIRVKLGILNGLAP